MNGLNSGLGAVLSSVQFLRIVSHLRSVSLGLENDEIIHHRVPDIPVADITRLKAGIRGTVRRAGFSSVELTVS